MNEVIFTTSQNGYEVKIIMRDNQYHVVLYNTLNCNIIEVYSSDIMRDSVNYIERLLRVL